MVADRPSAHFAAHHLWRHWHRRFCLAGQPVMAMFRRPRNPQPPLHRKQQEIAQQEAQLREKVESLERIVTQSRAPAQKKSSPREPERSATNNVADTRFTTPV